MKAKNLLFLVGILPGIVKSQCLETIQQYFSNELDLGAAAFVQGDFDHDGQVEFLTDADMQEYFFIAQENHSDIEIEVMGPVFTPNQISYDVKDLRYEDTNDDGQMEMYVFFRDEGLIQLDTMTLATLDTFPVFKSFFSYRNMILVDLDGDHVKEWVVMDEQDGLVAIDINTHLVKWSNPAIKGKKILVDNLDMDPNLELVVLAYNRIDIYDAVTFSNEYSYDINSVDQIELADINANGIPELIFKNSSDLYVYDHVEKKLTNHITGSIENFFVPYNLDQDSSLELLLIDNSYTGVREFKLYPVSLISTYELDEYDFVKFLGNSLAHPGELIFRSENRANYEPGLAFFNPITRTFRNTYATSQPNGIFIDHLGGSLQDVLVTKPIESPNLVNIRSLENLQTQYQVKLSDLFDNNMFQLSPGISAYHTKGSNNNQLLLGDSPDFALVDIKSSQHQSFYDLDARTIVANDLDFDSQDEFIISHQSTTRIYRTIEDVVAGKFWRTFPVANYNLRFAQLDNTKEKEMIGFSNKNIYVYNIKDGTQLHFWNDLTVSNIADVTTYVDEHGDFFIVLADESNIYVYNYSQLKEKKHFPYANPSSKARLNVIPLEQGNTITDLIAVFTTTLSLYSDVGILVAQRESEKVNFNEPGRILLSDSDHDFHPNITTSSYLKFTESEFCGPGEYRRPFYNTAIYPVDKSETTTYSAFHLQFSESISLDSISAGIQITSSQSGMISFEADSISDHDIQITPNASGTDQDTITISIGGNLTSQNFRFLDTNFDEVAKGKNEIPITSSYIYKPTSPAIRVSLEPQKVLPETVYTTTNRQIPFLVTSSNSLTGGNPIASVTSGFLQHPSTFNHGVPVDSIFDELTEEIKVPINTFSISPGDYQFFIVATDRGGIRSDTFFMPLKVVTEHGWYDKNEAGDNQRTSNIPNQVITTDLKLVAELSHSNFTSLSHVVGGEGSIYYLELPTQADTGFVRKYNLKTLSYEWSVAIPMKVKTGNIHLNDGLLYVTPTVDTQDEPFLFVIDAITGDIVEQIQYHSDIFAVSSPITNDAYIFAVGGNHAGVLEFNRWTGREHWLRSGPFNNYEEGPPSIYQNTCYLVSGNYIQAIDMPSGDVLWSKQPDDDSFFSFINAVIDTTHQQLIWGGEEHLFAFDLATGNENWITSTKRNQENLVLVDERVFHFSPDSVRVYNTVTGKLLARKKPADFIDYPPIASNHLLFVPMMNRFEIWDLASLGTIWSSTLPVNEVSVVDQYLILTGGSKISIYESESQCCNPSIHWTELQGTLCCAWSLRFTFDSIPTFINNHPYYEVLSSQAETGNEWEHTGQLLREADDQLYMYRSQGDVVICDYRLQVNDVFTDVAGQNLTVVKIDTVTLLDGNRRKQLTLVCEFGGDSIKWIKGLGSMVGLSMPQNNCTVDAGSELLCYWEGNTQLYQNPNYNTCWQDPVGNENITDAEIIVSPNPAHDQIQVSGIENPSQQIIYNLTGEIMYDGKDSPIDVHAFASGMYILEIRQKGHYSTFVKFLKL